MSSTSAIVLALLNFRFNPKRFIHGVLIITDLQLARRCEFMAERFRQSPHCSDFAGSNPDRGVLDWTTKRLWWLLLMLLKCSR